MPRNNPKTIRTKEAKDATKRAPKPKLSQAGMNRAFDRAVNP